MLRWSVDIIRKCAEHLGRVEALDEKAAIKKAAELRDPVQPPGHGGSFLAVHYGCLVR
jgi:hypothetical protein